MPNLGAVAESRRHFRCEITWAIVNFRWDSSLKEIPSPTVLRGFLGRIPRGQTDLFNSGTN